MVYSVLMTNLVGSQEPFFACFVSTKIIANLVLEDTYERIYHGNEFAEKHLGVFVVRGENVVLLGEIVCPFSMFTAYVLSPSCLGSRSRGRHPACPRRIRCYGRTPQARGSQQKAP